MFIGAIVQIPKEIGLWAKTMLVLLQTTAYGQKDHTHTRFLANGSLVFKSFDNGWNRCVTAKLDEHDVALG